MKKYKVSKWFNDLDDARATFLKLYPDWVHFLMKFPDKLENCVGIEVVEAEPRLSGAELSICKAVGATYVSRDNYNPNHVNLWSVRPEGPSEPWQRFTLPKECEHNAKYNMAAVAAYLFPSVGVGECIGVDEVIENAK